VLCPRDNRPKRSNWKVEFLALDLGEQEVFGIARDSSEVNGNMLFQEFGLTRLWDGYYWRRNSDFADPVTVCLV